MDAPINPRDGQLIESHNAVPIVAPGMTEITEPRSKIRITAILIALYLNIFVAALDQTIVATAVPTISAQLHSAAGYFWVGGAYLLANAASSPVWVKCSDIWGRKPTLLAATALFAIASIIAALSKSITMLIVARALQGTGGGGLMQLVTVTISDLFSMRRRTIYLGLLEVMWAVAGGAGPLIGGAFTQLASWRWCFWINLSVSCISLILMLLFLDVHSPRTRLIDGLLAIDWLGALSVVAMTLMLLLVLDFGGTVFPWSSAKVICLIIFGTLMLGVFVFSEKRLAKYPLMPLELFKNISNVATIVVGTFQGMIFISVEYFLPLYFQSVKQASPLRSGLLILPIVVSEALIALAASVIMHQTGRYREVIWAGAFLTALGTGLLISFKTSTPIATVIGFEILGGTGYVTQADTSTATATYGFLRNMAKAISIVIGGVVFQNRMGSHASELRMSGLNSTLVEAFSGGEAAASVERIANIESSTQRSVIKSAFASSLRSLWIFYTAIAAVGLVACVFVRQTRLNKEHRETKTGIQNMSQRVEVPLLT